jgi:hypothetical protein
MLISPSLADKALEDKPFLPAESDDCSREYTPIYPIKKKKKAIRFQELSHYVQCSSNEVC